MVRKVIFDTDPGIDDAVALAYLLFDSTIDLKLITTVSGNVGIDQVTNNALRLLDFFGKKVPVAKGASGPLLRESKSASDIHGESGMAGFHHEQLASDCLLEKNAIEAMYDELMISKEPVTIVAVGPLTNIALLIKTYPECLTKIKEIIFMGGAIGRGNYGVYTEFNIGFDPHAAAVVFNAPVAKTMVPLEIGDQAVITHDIKQHIRTYNRIGAMFCDLFDAYRGEWVRQDTEMYDSTAVAYLLRPEIYNVKSVFACVELDGVYTQGATVCDFDNILNQTPNMNVCVSVDKEGFRDWFTQGLEAMA